MRTSWLHVLIAIAGGYAVCLQLGKVPAALPLVGDEFDLTHWQRGAIVSSLSVLTAVSGIFIGLWANRFRAERIAILALTIAILSGLAGAATESFLPLLMTRLAEGLGYIMAMAALPAVVAAYCAVNDRSVAMALWSSSVPGGIAVLMLSSPLLIGSLGFDWRELWIATSVAMAVVLVAMVACFRPLRAPSHPPIARLPPLSDLREALQVRTVSLVGLFILYSVQFLAVISFLPTMLVEQNGLALGTAAFFGGIVAVGNALGAVLAATLIKAGLRRRNIIVVGYATMAVAAAFVLTDIAPLPVRLVAALVFAMVGALIPGTIWTYVPELASHPAQAPIYAGMFIQGSSLGQIIGPVVLGGLVDVFGAWEYALILTTIASPGGIALAFASQHDR